MQRTYSRKALRRRSGVQSQSLQANHEHDDNRSLPFRSPQVARGSIVKRMLGRSRTEPSLEAIPSSEGSPCEILRQTSSHSLPARSPERESEISADDSTRSSPKHIPARNIRTYAGSSRSFLVTLPVPNADMPLTAEDDDTDVHESYADLRTRWGIDLSEDDPPPHQVEQTATPKPLRRNPSELSQTSLPAGMMNDLKSITELRSKGENRRFLDEVGYLFEGLDGSSAISLRRASAFEIVNKLCDVDFNRRAKTSDFYLRTWNKVSPARGSTSDRVFDATIAFFAALAARDLRTLVDVAQQKDFVPTLVEILASFDHKRDVLALAIANLSNDTLKSHGILRTELTALKSLAKLVSEHFILPDQPSARFFISHSLATLPSSFLASEHVYTLLLNFRTELVLLEPCIAAHESGLPPVGTNGINTPSFFHIEASLRLLDSFLLGRWSPSDLAEEGLSSGLPHTDGLASELISLCVASSFLETKGEEDLARKCLCGAMRVLTLLSHGDRWWCEAALEVPHALPFVAMMVMRSQARWIEARIMGSHDSSMEAFDNLCLTLGLVMNWATLSPNVATLSRTKLINPSCPRSRHCIRACRCLDQTSILHCFTTLHIQYSEQHRDDPPEYSFLRGYTAILLGLLIKDDGSNQAIVLPMLPGISRLDKIRTLIVHSTAFLDLYHDISPQPSCDFLPVKSEDTHGTTDCRRASWDRRGEDVAQSVIACLEMLCHD